MRVELKLEPPLDAPPVTPELEADPADEAEPVDEALPPDEPDPLSALDPEAPGSLVATIVTPSDPVLVTTLGAPLILPRLAAALSWLIAPSRLWMLGWYASSAEAVNQLGVAVAVNADSRTAAGVPWTECWDATEMIALAAEAGM